MKPFLFCCSIILFSFHAIAQTPDDALRNAWFIPGGSARSMSIGGAMGSIGGDLTSNNVNPAGIGLYKTREIVLSPGFIFGNNTANFRGTNTGSNNSAFAYGATGFVVGGSAGESSPFKSYAFSISVNQLANYDNHIHYKGLNDYSSYSEQYLEELTRDQASPTAAEQNYIFGSSLAYRTYLIDTSTGNGQLTYFSLPNPATGLNQEYDAVTSGSYNEVSISLAGNINEKLYIGGSINIPIVSYRRDLTFTESDATGNLNNNFNYSTFTENFRSNGIGFNLKFGIIYKPQNNLRFGFAVHSPSFIWFKDQVRASMTTDTEKYAGVLSESSDNLNNGDPGQRNYLLQTPLKVIASATYLFNAVENTKMQRGFITADIEYTGYGGSRFSPSNASNADQATLDYYNTLTTSVSDYLKGNVNFRIGGELKFDPWAFRLGGAYYGNPYRDSQLHANRLQAGGGIGYRNHGLFIDFGYVQTFNKDVNFPYRLNDKANTFATINNNRGTVVITLGFKI